MQQIRELRLVYTVSTRGEAGNVQSLTGLIVHTKEPGLYKAVRGPVKVLQQGMALSNLCCRHITAV